MASSDLYLVRHGETVWNVSARYQGRLDSQLTDKGIAQAEAIGGRLASLDRVDKLFVSPLGRTRHTALIIGKLGVFPEPHTEPRIAEVLLEYWDGLTAIDIEAEWPDRLDGTTAFDCFFRSPDGESYEGAEDRVGSWLAELDGVVVAVSHGLIGRIIRGVYLGLSKSDALRLPIPQDVIWQLVEGKVEAISAG